MFQNISRLFSTLTCLLVSSSCFADCIEVFESLPNDRIIQCADGGYSIDDAFDGLLNPLTVENESLGQFNAILTDSDLFADGAPSTIVLPFLSSTSVLIDGPSSSASSIVSQHNGAINLGAAAVEFQQLFANTRSRLHFVPQTTDSVDSSIDITVSIGHVARLTDDEPNDSTTGAPFSGLSVRLFAPATPDLTDSLFVLDGLTTLDLDLSAEPEFFGDLTDAASSSPFGEMGADIVLLDETTISVAPNQPLTLESSTFWSALSDSSDLGTSSLWSSSSSEATVVLISSSDPSVTFFVPEPTFCVSFCWIVSALILKFRTRHS